uniref:ADAM10 endopeptidase n=1 Tax=Strongyloides papillosus TaxID=174720 RepID=A0A0N5BZL3_STREA
MNISQSSFSLSSFVRNIRNTRHKHILLFLFILNILSTLNGLNKFLDYYETLNYKPINNRWEDKRNGKEFNNGNGFVELKFTAFKRRFHLLLNPINEETGVFAHDHITDIDGNLDFEIREPKSFLYEGYLKDDPHSHVYGSIFDGIFNGQIHTTDGNTYTIETVNKYFDKNNLPKTYHSIIYHDENINHNKRSRMTRDTTSSNDNTIYSHTCGIDDEIAKEMKRIQESVILEDIPLGYQENIIEDDDDEIPYSISIPSRDTFSYFVMNNKTKHRLRRPKRNLHFIEQDDINNEKLYRVRTCNIYLQADHKLYEHFYYKEGNKDPIRTREIIIDLFYNHIKAVNQIYERTNFNGVKGLNFVIQRTSIYSPDTCENGQPVKGSDNPFCEENVDVSNFLNLNSKKNHSAFCLAYALTYRDFIGGTLGLAWVASPSAITAGGICQTYQRYNEGSRGWVYRSLNTGIVTLVNYGNRVPERVSQLTLAHEIGHNFGSPHDFPIECQPGLPDGNFLMFASATSGDKKNNDRFSKCSIQNISNVLFEVLRQPPNLYSHHPSYTINGKRNCFQERTSAFCGNQIKEPGEECDCGFSDTECLMMADKCCTPHEINGVIQGIGACKRKSGVRCSPSEGQCCEAKNCDFVPSLEKRVCREENDCQYKQFCDGYSPSCPDSLNKPNGSPCQDSTKVCQNGNCNGSICSYVGLKDCFLTEGAPDILCHLACEKNGKCISTMDLEEFSNGKFEQKGREGLNGLLLHPGSPCNNYRGYCDIFRKCRSVDSNGPLARLRNLVFNKQTIKTIREWITEHWYFCIGSGFVLLVLMALFVKCCAVHTPSTNPNKLPAQSFYDTLRHPGTLVRRRRGPTNGAYSVQPSSSSNQQRSANQNQRAVVAPANRQKRQKRQRTGGPSVETAVGNSRGISSSRNPPNPSAPPLISPPQPPTNPNVSSNRERITTSGAQNPPKPPSVASIPSSGLQIIQPQPSVIVVEPPPPYTATAEQSLPLFQAPKNGPPMGRRKNKKPTGDSK